jgi:hypothetical protein
MKVNYTITTDVTKESPNEGLSTSLRVFILVDSKSNLIPQYTPIYIDTETQFFYYFSENIEDYSDSLRTAYRLLNSGYTLMVMNVRKCDYKLSARIYTDHTLDYFFQDEVTNGIDSSIIDSEDLAIKFDLSTFKKNAFVLLEQKIRGVVSNTLIHTFDEPPLAYNNYHKIVKVDPKLSAEQKCEFLYKTLMKDGFFFTKKSENNRVLSIASPYKFTSIAIHENCEPLEFDKEFEIEYKERIKYKLKLIDYKSTYTSDLADLKVQVNKDNKKYTILVIKYSNGKAHTTESFTGELLDVLAEINSRSIFLRVNYSEDISYIPTGIFDLQCFPTNEKITDNHYEEALERLFEYKELEKDGNINLDILVNLVYEPDIYSIRSQMLISDIFDNEDIPIIKVFNYLNHGGEEDTQLAAYFDTKHYSYKGEDYSSKELFLKFLIERNLNKKITNVYYLREERPKDYPLYVNEFEQTPDGYNVTSIACLYNRKRFDILELLSVSMINLLARQVDKKDAADMQTVIMVTNTYFKTVMNYSPQIELAYFIKKDDSVFTGFYYSVPNPEEIKLLELNLKV